MRKDYVPMRARNWIGEEAKEKTNPRARKRAYLSASDRESANTRASESRSERE